MRPRQPLVVLPASFPREQGVRAERPPSPAQRPSARPSAARKAVQEPVPATKRGLLRLSPMTHTTTSTTVGDPEPVETPLLSSLPPQDFCGVADLTSIVQMWKLRLTKSPSALPGSAR
ncbi:uncharacterized protein ACBT57_009452 [Dama dama]